jgi:CxxC motif-containing protein
VPDKSCVEFASDYLCIVCPMGCRLQVEKDPESGELVVDGAACARGRDYVLQEATAPQRILTTTLATTWGRPLPVRSAAPIDKALLLRVQPMLAAIVIDRNVEIGEAVVPDLDGEGTPLVATSSARAPRRDRG